MYMKTRVTIVLNDVEFLVEGNYSAGSLGDYEYPPESSEFEIISIELAHFGSNLVEVFWNGIDYNDVVDQCIQSIEEAI